MTDLSTGSVWIFKGDKRLSRRCLKCIYLVSDCERQCMSQSGEKIRIVKVGQGK